MAQQKGSIRKRGKKGIYYLRYYVGPPGKRKQLWKCLDTTNQKEAEKAAKSQRALLAAEDQETQARILQHHVAAAAGLVDEAEKDLIEAITLAGAWQAFVDSDARPDPSEATLRQYRFQWQAFVDWMKKANAGTTELREVTQRDAAAYAKQLRDRKLSAGTFNKHLRLLRLVIRVLSEGQGMALNPFDKIEHKEEVQTHRRELSLDTIRALCDKADGEMKLLIFLGLYTGQRLGDCCGLTWAQVDLVRNVIMVTPSKTRRRGRAPITIPIHANLRPLLETVPHDSRTGNVVPELAIAYENRRDAVTDQFQALLVSCGVLPHEKGTGGKSGKRAKVIYGFHSLRHSAVTLLQEAGVPLAVTQTLVGHGSPAISARYTHIGSAALQDAVAKLPSIGRIESVEQSDSINDAQRIEQALARLAEEPDSTLVRDLVLILAGTAVAGSVKI